jgi:two-component system, response regulator / RNA-binding antiterminator
MDALLRAIEADPVFQHTDAPYLVVDRGLVIRAVNAAYLAATGSTRDELLGRYMFDAFPDNPDVPDADGVRNLNASLESVLRDSRRHRMHVQRYDVPTRSVPDDFVLKYWAPVNSPLPDERGRPAGVLHHVEDVTAVWSKMLRLDQSAPGEEPVTFDPEDQVGYARVLAHEDLVRSQATTEVAQLREALSSRILIEQAKGVVIAREGCDPDTAFAWLRRRARDTRTKLHDVCAAVVAGAHADAGREKQAGTDQGPRR